MFNTDSVLRWRLILEEYGPHKEYIKGEKNILVESPSRLTLNGNQETTYNSTHQKELVPETNDIEEITECTFPIN